MFSLFIYHHEKKIHFIYFCIYTKEKKNHVLESGHRTMNKSMDDLPRKVQGSFNLFDVE